MDGADAVIDSIADERGDQDDEDEEGNVIENYQHEGGCSRRQSLRILTLSRSLLGPTDVEQLVAGDIIPATGEDVYWEGEGGELDNTPHSLPSDETVSYAASDWSDSAVGIQIGRMSKFEPTKSLLYGYNHEKLDCGTSVTTQFRSSDSIYLMIYVVCGFGTISPSFSYTESVRRSKKGKALLLINQIHLDHVRAT
jgi:hypothetical protein